MTPWVESCRHCAKKTPDYDNNNDGLCVDCYLQFGHQGDENDESAADYLRSQGLPVDDKKLFSGKLINWAKKKSQDTSA